MYAEFILHSHSHLVRSVVNPGKHPDSLKSKMSELWSTATGRLISKISEGAPAETAMEAVWGSRAQSGILLLNLAKLIEKSWLHWRH